MSNTHRRAGLGGGGRSRFLWGGLGALAPTLISLAILDHTAVTDYISNIDQKTLALAGYGFRVVALFAIGGLWAYFHRSEVEPLKLFQLGIVAPAMITGMINAGRVSDDASGGGTAWLDFPIALTASAYAQEPVPPPQPPPQQEQSGIQQFINGVLGRP